VSGLELALEARFFFGIEVDLVALPVLVGQEGGPSVVDYLRRGDLPGPLEQKLGAVAVCIALDRPGPLEVALAAGLGNTPVRDELTQI